MTLPSLDVAGRRVLITGGRSGLGMAVANSFAQQGAQVAVIDSVDGGDGLHPNVYHGVADLSSDAAVPRFDEAIDHLGGLDVLFANAGVSIGDTAIDDLDWAAWQTVHAVNLDGVARSVQAVLPRLRESTAPRVIITTSIAGLRANARVPVAYQTSKAGAVALVKALAVTLGQQGINVNGIAPGPFATGVGGGWLRTPEGAQGASRVVPLGRIADPEEIVGAVQLLATEASSYINGAVLTVDGGATAGVF